MSSDNEKDIEFQNKNNITSGELIEDFTNEEKTFSLMHMIIIYMKIQIKKKILMKILKIQKVY